MARFSEIPSEARPLIQHLVEQRLLAIDVSKETRETTIEPAHEALLRQWGLLQGWLREDAGLLSVLDGIKRASRDWAANGKVAAWLAHGAERLQAAARLLARRDLAAKLEPTDKDYVAACEKAERQSRLRARRGKVLVGALAVLLALGGVGWWKQDLLREQYYWRVMMGPSILTAEQEASLREKQEFKECTNGCPTMVVVPSGTFMMGSPESEVERFKQEGPQHTVTLAKPFAVSKFDVTFEEWDQCTVAGVCPRASDSGWGRGNRPVINVSWDDAKIYVAWLSRLTGKEYRLLSEAEFEYAARAGSTTRYPWGDEIGENNANCSGCKSQWDLKGTAPVGSFKPNAFGLYDMPGNVFKWVEDCSSRSYEGAPADGSPLEKGSCAGRTIQGKDGKLPLTNGRVVRGGPWDLTPLFLRSASRHQLTAGYRNLDIGFRLARTLHP